MLNSLDLCHVDKLYTQISDKPRVYDNISNADIRSLLQ